MKEQKAATTKDREVNSRRKNPASNGGKIRHRIPEGGPAQPQHGPAILAQLEECYVADRSAMEGRGRAWGLYDPEDAVQDAYLSFLNASRLTPETIRWRNKRHRCRCCTALSKQIARDQRVTPLTDGLTEVLEGNDSNLELIDVRDEVAVILQQLPTNYREVLDLHYLKGLSIDEMVKLLGLSKSAIKSRLRYARRAAASVALRKIGKIPGSPRDPKANAPGYTHVE